MELSGLKNLFQSMKQQGIKRALFNVEIRNVQFECIYFIDTIPHSLAIGVKLQNFFFEIEVKRDFKINTYLDSTKYGSLYNILGLNPRGNETFSTNIFFTELNSEIPLKTNPKYVPKPSDVVFFRRDVEESERIYFYGWLDHSENSKNVTPENLEKTRKLLDKEAYDMCLVKNISSRWTDKKKLSKDYYMPKCIMTPKNN